jgi:hypothetical protein
MIWQVDLDMNKCFRRLLLHEQNTTEIVAVTAGLV